MKVQIPTQMMNDAIFIAKDLNGNKFPFKGMPGEFPEDTAQACGQVDLIGFDFLPININEYVGGIPANCGLIALEPDGEMYNLIGFDEVNMFDDAIFGFAPSIGNGDLSKFEFTENPEVFEAHIEKLKK